MGVSYRYSKGKENEMTQVVEHQAKGFRFGLERHRNEVTVTALDKKTNSKIWEVCGNDRVSMDASMTDDEIKSAIDQAIG